MDDLQAERPPAEPFTVWYCPTCNRKFAVPPGGRVVCYCTGFFRTLFRGGDQGSLPAFDPLCVSPIGRDGP